MFDIAIKEGDLAQVTFLGKATMCLVSQHLKQMILDHLLQKYQIRMNCTSKYFRIYGEHYHPDHALEPFKIMIKDFVDYSQLESYIKNYLQKLPYEDKVSGFIFRPESFSNKNLIYNFPKEGKPNVNASQTDYTNPNHQ